VESLARMVVPVALVLARVSGFVASMPVFGWRSVPVRLKAGLALVLTVLFASWPWPSSTPRSGRRA